MIRVWFICYLIRRELSLTRVVQTLSAVYLKIRHNCAIYIRDDIMSVYLATRTYYLELLQKCRRISENDCQSLLFNYMQNDCRNTEQIQKIVIWVILIPKRCRINAEIKNKYRKLDYSQFQQRINEELVQKYRNSVEYRNIYMNYDMYVEVMFVAQFSNI